MKWYYQYRGNGYGPFDTFTKAKKSFDRRCEVGYYVFSQARNFFFGDIKISKEKKIYSANIIVNCSRDVGDFLYAHKNPDGKFLKDKGVIK